MRYVFISKRGDVLPLAQRIEAESNDVNMFICSSEDIVVDRHITDFGPDLIVIDSFGFGHLAHRLKKNGFLVLGSSLLTDQLDNDPHCSRKVLQMCGIPVDSPNGIPLVIDAWFNGKRFINLLYTLDDVVFPGTMDDLIYKQGISRLAPAFSKADYQGPITLVADVTKDTVSYSTLRARFSPSTLLIFQEGLKGRVSNVLQAIATGQNRMFMLKPGWFTSVQISINSGPLFNGDHFYEIEAPKLPDEITKHLWMYGFTKKAQDHYLYKGQGGRIAVATARGDTIREARRRVYRTIFNLNIPDILFLQKVGQKATGWYGQIKQWGVIA